MLAEVILTANYLNALSRCHFMGWLAVCVNKHKHCATSKIITNFVKHLLQIHWPRIAYCLCSHSHLVWDSSL